MTALTSTPTVLSTFAANTDSVGTAQGDPAFCGAKTYVSDFAPVSVTVPGNSPNAIEFASSDYTAHVGLFTVTITVGFLNFTPTITQTFDLEVLHPCKITQITTTQTIPDISFPFGGTALLTPFTNFDDTVSTEYGITDLCVLSYSLELAADATAYGTSIIAGAPPNIQVLTNDPLLKGTSITLTLSAVATLFPQDTPS